LLFTELPLPSAEEVEQTEDDETLEQNEDQPDTVNLVVTTSNVHIRKDDKDEAGPGVSLDGKVIQRRLFASGVIFLPTLF